MSRFSPLVAEHFHAPSNRHAMPQADRVGCAAIGGGGPTVTIYLKLDQDHITAAAFEAFGCGVTIACGSMLTELVLGLSLADCQRFTPRHLIASLQGLPPDKEYCAHVVVEALQRAVGKNADTSSS